MMELFVVFCFSPFVVDYLECTFGIFGHCHATASKYSIRSCKNVFVKMNRWRYLGGCRVVYVLSSGISILKVNLSPIRTVSTSLVLLSRIRILGGGASGALVMLIISGSRIGIIPKVMFFDDMS